MSSEVSGAGVAALVEGELLEEPGEVAGVESLGERLDLGEDVAVGGAEAGGGDGGLDLVAAGRVGVDADGGGGPRRLEGLAQRAARAEVAGGDDEGGVAGPPVLERRPQGRGGGVARVLDEDDTGAGEEARRAHGVGGGGGVAAEVGAGEAGEAHLGGAVRPDQRLDEGGALQGHAHGVGAMEEDAGAPRVGAGEEAGGVAAGQLHGATLMVRSWRDRDPGARGEGEALDDLVGEGDGEAFLRVALGGAAGEGGARRLDAGRCSR